MPETSERSRDILSIKSAANNAILAFSDKDQICLLLIGSWSLNLGTPTSDVDLLLISEQRVLGSPEWLDFQARITRELSWVQVSNITKEDFRNLLSKARLPDYSSLSSRTLELIYKYANGCALYGTAIFQALVAEFSSQEFSFKIANYYMEKTLNVYQDVLGSRLATDYQSAALSVRELVGLGFDAYLALIGDAYPKAKWRLKRANRVGLNEKLLKAVERCLVGGPSNDPDEAWLWIERGLIVFRQLQFLVYYPSAESRPIPEEQVPLSVNPWAFVFKRNGKWHITERDRFFQVDEHAVIILFALSMNLDPYETVCFYDPNFAQVDSCPSLFVKSKTETLRKVGAI